MIVQTKAKVIKNIEVIEKYYKILLLNPKIANASNPGQFVNIKITDSVELFLRRPFSIHRLGYRVAGIGYRAQIENREPNTIEILYEVVGKGTEILANKKPGEYLDVIGPLGNGFSILNTQYSILVAGGIGVAPLLLLAQKLVTSHQSPVTRKIMVLLGAKTKNQILCEKEFKDLGCVVKISTDDGSKGFKGKITDLLKNLLSTIDYPCLPDRQGLSTMYACGPTPMLKEIIRLSLKYKVPAQVSLEEHMACGIGACLGCVVNTTEGYKRVCKEGPVFNADEIVW